MFSCYLCYLIITNCEIDIIINILDMRYLGLRLNNPILGQLQQVVESGFSHLIGLTGITMLFTWSHLASLSLESTV